MKHDDNLSFFNDKSWEIDRLVSFNLMYECENYLIKNGFNYFLSYPHSTNNIFRQIKKDMTIFGKITADFTKNNKKAIFNPAYSKSYKHRYCANILGTSIFYKEFSKGVNWLKKHPSSLVSVDGTLLEPFISSSTKFNDNKVKMQISFDDYDFFIEFKLSWI